ncbi:hypothetical protein Hanom_Chr05g00474471 [Helianthus anomalus]
MSKLGTKCVTRCKPQGPSMYFRKKQCVTNCKPQGPSVYFCKAKDQIQNFRKPQGPFAYYSLKVSSETKLQTSNKKKANTPWC